MADKTARHPFDASIVIRYIDQGDGTYAERVTTTGMVSKTARHPFDQSIVLNFVDQGDGTHAEKVTVAGLLGTSRTAVASGAIAAHSLVYVKADGTLALADATAEGKEAVGFTALAYANGETATFYSEGSIMSGLAGLTPGSAYFMTTVPGVVGAAPGATGNVVQHVGTALSATELVFATYNPITL